MKNICVYGASSASIDQVYLDAAYALGEAIAESGYGLVFGAGDTGVMGATARGAHHAGGRVIGVLPEFMAEVDGIAYPDCDELIVAATMRERKKALEELSFAYITAPGGIGTLEEFFEILTLKQLQQHQKPLVIYNTQDYYAPLFTLLDRCVRQSFAAPSMRRLYGVAATPQAALSYIETYAAEEPEGPWHAGRST